MKKIPITLSLIATLLSGSTIAKVTYDEAYAADQARTQRNRDTTLSQEDLVGGLDISKYTVTDDGWNEIRNDSWITIASQSYSGGYHTTQWGSAHTDGSFLSLNLEANITSSNGNTLRESIFAGTVPINSSVNNVVYSNPDFVGERCNFDIKVTVMDNSRIKVDSHKTGCAGSGKGSTMKVYAKNVYYYTGS